MPPQTNATVITVGEAHAATGGAVDDWDVQVPAPAAGSPALAALTKWSGAVRAYYRETGERVSVNGSTDVALKRELILDTADVLAMHLDTDDVITFDVDDRPGPVTGRAKVIPTPSMAGVPRALQTARIRLEDA
jgi:hypothetical protein